VVSSDSLFSTFLGIDLNILMQQGIIIGWIGIIGMSLALWTTGDANLYLPVIQTSSILKRPKNVMTVICGILGTILGLGLYQYFFGFLNLLASLVPPLIGPVIVEYYVINKEKFHSGSFEGIASWNPSAFIAYIAGAVSTYYSPAFIMPAITGLLTSMIVYWVARKVLTR
jgi:cytosine permease